MKNDKTVELVGSTKLTKDYEIDESHVDEMRTAFSSFIEFDDNSVVYKENRGNPSIKDSTKDNGGNTTNTKRRTGSKVSAIVEGDFTPDKTFYISQSSYDFKYHAFQNQILI